MRKYALGIILFYSWALQGADISTPLSQAKWTLQFDSPLQCQLSHDIASFGQVKIVKQAGEQYSQFVLTSNQVNRLSQKVKFLQLAPPWQPGEQPKELFEADYHAHFDLVLGETETQNIIEVLAQGAQTGLLIKSAPHQQYGRVVVQPVNFQNNFQRYQKCLSRLLDYRFEDIALTVIGYQHGSERFTLSSLQQLKKIKRYLALQPEVTAVIISAYTDSYGTPASNKTMSEKRIEALQAYFSDIGIDDRIIVKNAYGEKRFIDSNASEFGRANNRRVMIELKRD
ncbi:OmpA family protein [Paraferrimonas sp. SM1919]|uniref:OmpA family protein n=1 Tax=Paraferrimonas sp. SM1919 TaxID=2662263 RepID=UPI0013D76D18|nr:OmpA family protein [Paraferrimonas sp. SM1919]